MSQTYSDIPSSTTLTASRQMILDRDEALRTNFSGTAFPASNLVIGMRCHRTDLNQVYSLKTTSPVTWVLVEDLGKTYLSKETADWIYQAALGFYPVQQGGLPGWGTNKVYIGWSAALKLRVQVDVTDFGTTWPIDIAGNSATATTATTAATATNATKVGNVTPSAFVLTLLDDADAETFRSTIAAAALASPTFTGTVSGAAGAFTGNFSVGGTFSATGNATLTGTLSVTGNIYNDANSYLGISGTNVNFTFDSADYMQYDRTNNDLNFFIASTKYVYFNTGGIYTTQNVTAYASDKRLKKDLRQITDWRTILGGLTGYRFKWNDAGRAAIGPACTTEDEVGFLAQDVKAVLPAAAAENPALSQPKGEDPYLTVRSDRLVPVLVEAVKELTAMVDGLRDELTALRTN